MPAPLTRRVCGIAMLALAALGSHASADETLQAELIGVKRIWDEGRHNAFTDLIRWEDAWWCAFREGDTHAGSHGFLRVLTSTDGEAWEPVARLDHNEFDLRDANLSITPSGELMMVGGAQIDRDNRRLTGTFTAATTDGRTWTTPAMVIEPGRWMWGVTWREGTAYGVSYGTPDNAGRNELLTSTDGRSFNVFAPDFLTIGGRPTEARIRFADSGVAYCLQRCDGDDNHAYLGKADPPYRDWQWRRLDRFIGGPNLLQLPSGRWVAAGRQLLKAGARTVIAELNPADGHLENILVLPSGGDCSYPGLVWHEDRLWVSYYSSHEDHTSIYLAQVSIED
ncbi:hypothetical protein Pla123a_00190 [Posidoniimonas polymericola]|uniref:Exo-alpha-sialidase n=1 Tax=Posidoniimonas polymericola TaxID=2528002 RepID=A0A5C5ZF80_9BACT|nr:exo-alpha-sialidase [Posidoniimonas polymericola]TWT85213.1 hypothetical protein Pla123a_00190 [Posidoniimonas polymericola]